jgi:nucleoside-diphosphate-sugar epimerase
LKIAILGATSHVAKGLIYNLGHGGEYDLRLFARSPDRVGEFLTAVGLSGRFHAKTFDEFDRGSYDAIVNCVGFGDPGKLKDAASAIFQVTETFDNLVLGHLERHPESIYINFSSGAVYGTDFASPADEKCQAIFDINPMYPAAYYGIAKLHSEARHRATKDFRIVDLRIFGYFSRFIDLDAKYMMSEIVSCVLHGKEFVTGPDDIVRDYVHPEDLASLVKLCIAKRDLNDAFDVCSLKPVRKFEILERFSSLYGLKYTVKDNIGSQSATGKKANYYSTNDRFRAIGFSPRFSSIESIIREAKFIRNFHSL